MWRIIVIVLLALLPLMGQERGAVATVHPLATKAGMDALAKGGNAVDAAIAAALTLGVVDGFNSGIGGGCFMLIRLKDGQVFAIDGRETAPARATRDMYLRNGKADPELSTTGALAVGVPGALAAYSYASTNFANLSLRQHFLDTATVAEKGFPVSSSYLQRVHSVAKNLSPAGEQILRPKTLKAGELFIQKDLGSTYRSIAAHGPAWFYEGPFARDVARWMGKNGGILEARDFAAYQVKLREPLRTTYRGSEIIGFPPPSSGGVHVGQILNILEQFDLKSMESSPAAWVHLVTEAMKLAFADRAHWLGDPDFTDVPKNLISRKYASDLAKKIDLRKASRVESHGSPEDTESIFRKHTTHFSTIDAEGNWVACTATINTTFGSKVVVPGTGVFLNNEMDDFAAQPNTPNSFGLVGAEANAISPGKRPLSSMSPTILLQNGKPVYSVGAAGGPTIISATLLAIVRYVDFNLSGPKSLGAFRFHHQWNPDELLVEQSAAAGIADELKKLGHQVKLVKSIAAAQAVQQLPDGKMIAIREPRLD